jgi:group I intron endonuclease
MINIDSKTPIIGIYKIFSPVGKIYIGQSKNIYKRWKFYSFYNCKNQIKLYNSLQKYGFENHVFEIIEECSIEQLNERETHWKQHYLDQVNGDWKQVMFCKLHDNSGGSLPEEIKKKISKSSLGKPKTQQHKDNIKKSRKGMVFTQQHKDNMSNSRFRHKVLCIENNTIYKSASQAAKDLNIFPSPIIKVCKGENYQTKGYTFKFVK